MNAKSFQGNNKDSSKYICKRLSLMVLLFFGIAALIAFASSFLHGNAGLIAPYVIIALAFLTCCLIPCRTCIYFASSCQYYETPINEMNAYKDEHLMEICWNKVNTRWNKTHDVFDQVMEGYCAFATMNSVLSSIYKQRLYLEYPVKIKALTLNQMQTILTNNILNDQSIKNDFPNIKIESFDVIIMEPDYISLSQFENMIKEIDTIHNANDKLGKEVYFIANFNRAPLFFCNYGWIQRWKKWIWTGHFSPIISYCYEDNTMYILIGDVNSKYGNYLVRSDRLYEAMKCRQITKTRRGLLKITVNRKLKLKFEAK
eukprot:199965_1